MPMRGRIIWRHSLLTHLPKAIKLLTPDVVHVMIMRIIVKNGGKLELAKR